MNVYAYVSGHVLKSVDPVGLSDERRTYATALFMVGISEAASALDNEYLAPAARALLKKKNTRFSFGKTEEIHDMETSSGGSRVVLNREKSTRLENLDRAELGAVSLHEVKHVADAKSGMNQDRSEGRGYAVQTFILDNIGPRASATERANTWNNSINAVASQVPNLFRREFVKTYGTLQELQKIANGDAGGSVLMGFKLADGTAIDADSAKRMIAEYITGDLGDGTHTDLVRAEGKVMQHMRSVVASGSLPFKQLAGLAYGSIGYEGVEAEGRVQFEAGRQENPD